jgi:ABC-type Na+ efflux pump permease subunit
VSPLADQGRNNAALQVAEALGSTLLVGLAGTVYAWLAPGGLTGAFGWLLASMTAFAVLGLGAAVRVGRVTDHS